MTVTLVPHGIRGTGSAPGLGKDKGMEVFQKARGCLCAVPSSRLLLKYAFVVQICTRWAVTMKQLLIRTVCADFIHAVFVSYMSVNRLHRRCRYTYTPPDAPFDAPDGCSAHRCLFRRSTTGNSELSYWRCRTECRKQH